MARIGIRREDKNEWERRVPLTPDHVAELADKHDVAFSVQPSANRAFPDKDYRTAGARLDDALEGCKLVLGVKEIPETLLEAGRAYLYFSHTTKAQATNMPMLRRLLQLGCTLLDYEHVLDERGRRLIFFGRYAGHAGMIDTLWALGRRLATEGHVTPFERVRLAHDYSNLDEATHHIHRIGERLRHTGIPDELFPIVCGFTGSGNVSRGAQEIFDRLPHVELDPEELAGLAGDPQRPRNVLYKTAFSRSQRAALPRYLPNLTMLIHGAFWSPDQPRLVSIADLKALWQGRPPALKVIADISCDIGGGIEATVRPTTPDRPVFVYDVERDTTPEGVEGHGPVILAVDNLPCQLPVEASEHFADTLARFVPALARCDWTQPLDELQLPRALTDAIVVHRGELTPRYAYLEPHVGV